MTNLKFFLFIFSLHFKLIFSNTLHTSVACFSKDFVVHNFTTTENVNIPFRINGDECGEDDFLISESESIHLLTVADGVGGWYKYNVDPKIFTKELLKSINVEFKLLKNSDLLTHDDKNNSFLLDIVRDSYMDTLVNKRFIPLGSCTLVVLSLNIKTLYLNSYVLGDSGFMIIRKRKIIYRSEDLMIKFNYPHQLASDIAYSSSITEGFITSIQLETNDIIVIATDGLFDNLFDEAILYYVNLETINLTISIQNGYSEAARRIAKKLTIEAKRIAESVNEVASPYSEAVNEINNVITNFKLYTGKNDDTTVVVSIIS